MTCSTPRAWRNAVSRGTGKKKDIAISKPSGASVHCGLGKVSPLIHSAGLTELLLWCANENVCVSVGVCGHWLWLNMSCGINSDYGWASFLCNQTNWLTSRVRNWTEFLLWLPLCCVLSTCQPGAEKWESKSSQKQEEELQFWEFSQHSPVQADLFPDEARAHRWPQSGSTLSTVTGDITSTAAVLDTASCQWPQNLPRWKPWKRQGHRRLPHSLGKSCHVKW